MTTQENISKDELIIQNFVDQFIELRKLEDLTQIDVAKATGLTQAQISNIEHGVTKPGLVTIAKLANFYNKEIRLVDSD